MKEKFQPLNGQGVCEYAQVYYGWRRVKHNGCGLLAAYNALGLLGKPLPFGQIRRYFHRRWRPRFLGTNAYELRRFFQRQGLPVQVTRDPRELEAWLKEGGVGVMIQWNSTLRLWGLRLPNPAKGAHVVTATWGPEGLTVYNRYSNRDRAYTYSSMEELYQKASLLFGLYIKGKQVRKATRQDLDALAELYDRAVLHLQATVNYPKWEYGVYPCRDSVEQAILKGEQFLCEEEGQLLGAFILNEDPKGAYEKGEWKQTLSEGDYAVIHTLAVDPAAKGKGVGRRMVEFCISHGKQRGYKALRMDVVPENLPAIRLYESLGFTFAGQVDLERNHPEIPLFSLYERDLT